MLTKAQIIDGLFTLSMEERLQVRDLLNDELDESVAAAWTAELDGRLERLRRGETTASPWPEVKARLEQRLAEIEELGHPE